MKIDIRRLLMLWIKTTLAAFTLVVTLCFTSFSAHAVTLTIGDVDGFGFVNPNASYLSAQGALPDTNGNGIIEAGEYLPNLAGVASAVNTEDVFDNRSAAETSATDGAQWTDRSLQSATTPPHNKSFTFNFVVPTLGDLDYGVDHFINLIFGDYDVSPTSIVVDGVTTALTAQSNADDGLVQLAYATVDWNKMTDGQVVIKILAPNEPYLAVDYAYLHTENVAAPVPAPASLLIFLVGLAYATRRQ